VKYIAGDKGYQASGDIHARLTDLSSDKPRSIPPAIQTAPVAV
jgi:hypothetical protein